MGCTYIKYTNRGKIKQNYGKLLPMTIQIPNGKKYFESSRFYTVKPLFLTASLTFHLYFFDLFLKEKAILGFSYIINVFNKSKKEVNT